MEGREREPRIPTDDIPTPEPARRPFRHPLVVHAGVDEQIRRHGELNRLTSLTVEALASTATARYTDNKVDEEGCRRSIVGTFDGTAVSLWWRRETPAGLPGEPRAQAGDRIRLLALGPEKHVRQEGREVRKAGQLGLLRAFLSDPQAEFITDTTAVRMLVGPARAGKSTALRHATACRDDGRVLFLTATPEAAAETASWFESFGGRDTRIDVLDHWAFVKAALGEPDRARTEGVELRKAFGELVGKMTAPTKEGWRRGPDNLYHELRAELLGRKWPVEQDEGWENLKRDTREYWRTGAAHGAREQARTGRDALVALRTMGPATTGKLFPDTHAGAEAARRLHELELPAGWRDYRRIVIDDAEELTGNEIDALVTLAERIGTANGTLPCVLLAAAPEIITGASGYRTREAARQLGRLGVTPAGYGLGCRRGQALRIADTIEATTINYETLSGSSAERYWGDDMGDDDDEMPGDETNDERPGVCGRVLTVRSDGTEETRRLLEALAREPGTAIATTAAEPPAWTAEVRGATILTAEETKGRSWDRMVVLGAGRTLLETAAAMRTAMSSGHAAAVPAVEVQARRTLAAMSRADRTLVLIDESTREMVELESLLDAVTGGMLDQAADCTVAEALDCLAGPEETDAVVRERGAAIERNRDDAATQWRLASQIAELLGHPGEHGSVQDTEVRERAAAAGLTAIGRTAYAAGPSDETGQAACELAQALSHYGGGSKSPNEGRPERRWSQQAAMMHAVAAVHLVADAREACRTMPGRKAPRIVEAATAAAAARTGWPGSWWAEPILERLKERHWEIMALLAADPTAAGTLTYETATAYIDGLGLQACGTGGDAAEELGRRAIDTIIREIGSTATGRSSDDTRRRDLTAAAERLAGSMTRHGAEPWKVQSAAIAELLERREEAERLYVEAEVPEAATAMWRDVGELDNALRTARGHEREVIRWTGAVVRSVRNAPQGARQGRTERERNRQALRRITDAIRTGSAAKGMTR